ncbi:DarT ssDNA thymidine ADP-ribosyltransferase family protein, partial [Pontibacter rugosus]|uniref:DarT ssDNA thymidine ADP-ribosyltransferase family protein n=1 Tax=Pontibacter rugosus TaxID=1745966 RepID=UPI00366CCA13
MIEKYRNKWDWQLLRTNPQIIEKLEYILGKYREEFKIVEFLGQFDGAPAIYHFTHLFNAIDIIKDRKILSRNKAEGKFANAAGNLVARRGTAHDYARFYFRPKTPTQFYNECLGHDSSSGFLKSWKYWDGDWIHCSKWKTFYPQARNLGLPKCPLPVFFKFDLKEVLLKMADICYYSTGNMQSNWARIEKVSENPFAINTSYLYSDISDFENYK